MLKLLQRARDRTGVQHAPHAASHGYSADARCVQTNVWRGTRTSPPAAARRCRQILLPRNDACATFRLASEDVASSGASGSEALSKSGRARDLQRAECGARAARVQARRCQSTPRPVRAPAEPPNCASVRYEPFEADVSSRGGMRPAPAGGPATAGTLSDGFCSARRLSADARPEGQWRRGGSACVLHDAVGTQGSPGRCENGRKSGARSDARGARGRPQDDAGRRPRVVNAARCAHVRLTGALHCRGRPCGGACTRARAGGAVGSARHGGPARGA
jgi:hypothetical protein